MNPVVPLFAVFNKQCTPLRYSGFMFLVWTQLLLIRTFRCFLKYFYFRVTCAEVEALNSCWIERWWEWSSLEEEQGYLPSSDSDKSPRWDPGPHSSACWCNCTWMRRKRSNKVRTELRLALNLIPNHGTCQSLSQQQEYTPERSPVCKQTSGLPIKAPADMGWTHRVQTEKHHLGGQTKAPGPHVAQWTT